MLFCLRQSFCALAPQALMFDLVALFSVGVNVVVVCVAMTVDKTAPSITAPPATSLVFDAASPQGAYATFFPVVSDLVTPTSSIFVNCDHASGALYPVVSQ